MGGSAEIGAKKLCEISVKQARSPAAAAAIVWAFNHLGEPYNPVASRSTSRTSAVQLRNIRGEGLLLGYSQRGLLGSHGRPPMPQHPT